MNTETIIVPCECGSEAAYWSGDTRKRYLCDDCRKSEFIYQLEKQEIDSVIENMEWNDTIMYYWPSFLEWLKRHGLNDKEIELIRDEYNLNWEWETIKTEHSGGFYTVSDNQFILCTNDESEQSIGEWYTDQEIEWIKDEYTVSDSGEYFYIYNPTAYYITISDIRDWLKENSEV